MFCGKQKAVTFSFDDGVTQDLRVIEILNKYNLKCTFNLNSARMGEEGVLESHGVAADHSRFSAEKIRSIYEGHEVAAHTLTHPNLVFIDDDQEIIRQVEQDRLRLSELVGYEVVGFAYPGGDVNHNDHIIQLLKEHTGVRYARINGISKSFEAPADLFRFQGTVDTRSVPKEELFAMADQFLNSSPDRPQILTVYGHSYAYDYEPRSWDIFEEFCAYISNRQDVFYGTTREVLLGE